MHKMMVTVEGKMTMVVVMVTLVELVVAVVNISECRV